MTACLPAAGAAWRPSAAELEGRRDLREGRALVASIDPPGCVDIDDALHCHEVAPGTWEANPHPHPQANPHPHPHPNPSPSPNPNQVAPGTWEVGVHIADVSHFVAAGCALDEAAAKRGTSTYLVEQAPPTHPDPWP